MYDSDNFFIENSAFTWTHPAPTGSISESIGLAKPNLDFLIFCVIFLHKLQNPDSSLAARLTS
jgi:hypothetical protein